jgi:metallo-beta-lactamase family protein
MKKKDSSKKIKISFLGGAQEVTGACYLVEDKETGKKIMVDCGLIQGAGDDERNHERFSFNVSDVEAIFVTHPHLDHVGRIPKMVKEGFAGKIYSVPPAKDLAKLVLEDSLNVFEKQLRKKGKGEMMYGEEDIANAMNCWEVLEYHKEIKIGPFTVSYYDPGHILGSGMVKITINDKNIYFTGDLGNSESTLLDEAEKIIDADYLIMEALYGDKQREEADTQLELERIIESLAKNRGVLMIPAFSIERTQKILFQINDLVEKGRVPRMPVFLDSPLAIKVTDVYRKYIKYLGPEAQKHFLAGDADIFSFPGLKTTPTTLESRQINEVPAPKIIIAGSGMSNGGRILHHEKRYLPGANNILMIVSYQVPGSLGRLLMDGARDVNIMGERVHVAASVVRVEGYSSHPDIDGLVTMVENTLDRVKKVFIVQGEPKTELFFAQKLKDSLGVDACVPQYGEVHEIDV